MNTYNKDETSSAFGELIVGISVIAVLALVGLIFDEFEKRDEKVWCEKNKIHAENYFKNCRSGGEMEKCFALETTYEKYKRICGRSLD